MRMENSFVVQMSVEQGAWGDVAEGLANTAEAEAWVKENGMRGGIYRVVSVRTPLLEVQEATTRHVVEAEKETLEGEDDDE